MYHTPYEQFGYLSYQTFRASRLVVDTGLHHLHWTRKQALDYVRANTGLGDHEIETKVDRYIAWPAQALSYYLGEMAIRQDRARAEKALGPKFDIRASTTRCCRPVRYRCPYSTRASTSSSPVAASHPMPTRRTATAIRRE